MLIYFFFLNDTATPEIYPLSLPDALPICGRVTSRMGRPRLRANSCDSCRLDDVMRVPSGYTPIHSGRGTRPDSDRKSTRLNSSHANISYAVFCLKKKKYS